PMLSIRRTLSRFRHVLPLSLTSFFGDRARRRQRRRDASPRSVPGLEVLEDRTLMAISLTTAIPLWVEQGPGPITQAQLNTPPDSRATAAVEGRAVRRVLPTATDAIPDDGVVDVTTQVVLVATVQPLVGGRPGGVFRSADAGNSFTPVAGLPDGDATDVIADPNVTSRFYAAIAGKGV